MQKSEIKYVGFSTKLIVKEDGFATGMFGTLKDTLQKGEELICTKVVEDKYEIFFEAESASKGQLVVHYVQVELSEKPYDIELTKPIVNTKDLCPAMGLIVVGEGSELGVGTKVTFSHMHSGIGLILAVNTLYEGKHYYNMAKVNLSQLAIPSHIITRTELIENLMNFIENNEPLISKEKTIEMLKTIK